MKKVFTENLSKTWRGISWEKAIGKDLEFIYDDIRDKFKILDYNNPKKGYIKLLYKDEEFYIHSSNITKNKIGDIIGKINREMKYNVGQCIKDKNRDLIIINIKHKNGKKLYKYKCNKCGFDCSKHWSIRDKEYKDELWTTEGNLDRGIGCSCYSTPKIIVENINSIYKTDPWMIPYIGEECAKTHTKCSTDKVEVTCPYCKTIKEYKISYIYRLHSIACSCGDGQSYISKYILNLLEQLKLYPKSEITYEWCKFYNPFKNKNTYGIYDFVLEDNKLIIEVDGDFHRKNNKMNGQTKEESEWLDSIKDKLALEHGYKMIRISDEGNFRQNILNSRLNELFDLSKIDWLKAEEFALSNLVKVACDYKRNNPNITTVQIGQIMGYCQASIIKWLKKGSKFGWCDYNPKEEQKRNSFKKKVQCIDDGKIFNSIMEASLYYNIDDSSISGVCNNKRKTAGKRKFKFI